MQFELGLAYLMGSLKKHLWLESEAYQRSNHRGNHVSVFRKQVERYRSESHEQKGHAAETSSVRGTSDYGIASAKCTSAEAEW